MGWISLVYIPHVLNSSMFSIIMGRLERDRPSIKPVDKFTFKEVMRSASSPHVIMVFIMFFMTGTMLYGLALFLPSIVSQLGFSATKTQLLSVGPFAAGFFGERVLFRISRGSYTFSSFAHGSSDYIFCFLVRSL